ncbi:MAG: hypothetical protein QOC92_601 [Acidimicrobiaceae bacterium]|jgi:uncharacterized RDD family membrane protein YckC
MAAGEVRGVVTPEAVVLEFETASVASRSLAQALDLIIRFGMLYALLIVAGLFGATVGTTPAIVLIFVGVFVLLFGYPALLEVRWNGQTIGKRAFGLRVVTVEGSPVRFRHAAIRSLLAIVDFFLPPIGVSATCVALLNRRNQRLGDIFAGTIVLRERTGAAFPVPVSFPPLPGYEQYARSLDVGGLTPDQYAVIRSFLIRVNSLTPAARAHLATRLANAVALSMRHTPPAAVSPETFLVSVAAAYQLRQGGPPVPLPPWMPQWGASRPSVATMAR